MKKRIMTGSLIKAWAKKPDNKEKAKELHHTAQKLDGIYCECMTIQKSTT